MKAKRIATLASLGALIALSACEFRLEDDAAAEMESLCVAVMFEGTPFTHCTAEPARHHVGMDLAAEGSEEPFRSLYRFSIEFPVKRAPYVLLAMNGGMFDAEGQPIGYYVEEGRRLTVLNENDGPGNFHLRPNGVFFGEADGSWQVMETSAFAQSVENRPDFATQSGPMLVVDGELHPAIDPDGESRKIRNAVGIDAGGRAHFVISEAPVSFGKLARYYRDVLNVDNALFLDGSVSQIWDPANDRLDTGPEIGPLIVVRNRAETAP